MVNDSSSLTSYLKTLLANTYALYLKTQNYHWHVKGPHFSILHQLFESQYQALALAVDEIAEQIRIKGENAPATFTDLNQLKTIQDGKAESKANDMVQELAEDHGVLYDFLNEGLKMAQALGDESSIQLLSERLSFHEKTRWMLQVSQESV